MTRGGKAPLTCRECPTRIVFASRNGRRLPYEADAREPFTDRATGCHVVVGEQAMTLTEAIEHVRTRFEVSEAKARDTVAGYPAHRPHFHARPDEEPTA